MLVKVFNLRLDMNTLQYDDSILSRFVGEHEVVSMKTQFFSYREEPMWSVMVVYRNQYKASALLDASTPKMEYKGIPKQQTVSSNISYVLKHTMYEKLREWRNETARRLGHPPSNLFSNRQLDEIATLCPKSIHQLQSVHGVGTYKSSTYGHEILAILESCRNHTDVVDIAEQHPEISVGTATQVAVVTVEHHDNE